MNTSLPARSLASNMIGAKTEGITALCDGLKGSAVTSLECAAAPNLHADCTQCHCPADPQKCSAPAENFACRARSVDGHPLPIDELKGTKPTEKIDLSNKKLGVASAIIIASCIKDNGSLKELRCVQSPTSHRRSVNTSDMPLLGRSAGLARTTSAWRAPRRSPPCSRIPSCLRCCALPVHSIVTPSNVSAR